MNFRKLLLGISNSLVSSELEQLKYLCTEYIPEGEAETIKYGFKLFAALERRGKLSEKNRDLLASLLGDIQRIDLKNKLLEIEGDQNMQLDGQSTCTTITYTSAAGQYINDSEIIDYGIIKIDNSENENPSSAIDKAAAGQYINDSEVIDCHSDIVSDDGIVTIKDSENENPSRAIDKGNVKDNGLNHHQIQLSVKFLFNEQPLSPNEFKDYLTYIVKSMIYNNYDLNDESDTFAKTFNSDEINTLSKIIAKIIMSNSKIYQKGKRTKKHRNDKRRKVSLLKFFENLLRNAQTTPLQDRDNTWVQQGMKRSDQSFIKMFYNLLIPKFGGVFDNIKFDCNGFLVWKNNNKKLKLEEYHTVINQITIKYIEYFCQLKKNAVFHDHYDDQWDEYKFDIKCCLLILEERLDWCAENILSDINGYTEWKYQIYVDISYAALSVVLAMILSKIDKGWKPSYISRY